MTRGELIKLLHELQDDTPVIVCVSFSGVDFDVDISATSLEIGRRKDGSYFDVFMLWADDPAKEKRK